MLYIMSTKPAGNVLWGFCIKCGYTYEPCTRFHEHTWRINHHIVDLTNHKHVSKLDILQTNRLAPFLRRLSLQKPRHQAELDHRYFSCPSVLLQRSAVSSGLPRSSQQPGGHSSECSSNCLYQFLYYSIREMSICLTINVLTNHLTPVSPSWTGSFKNGNAGYLNCVNVEYLITV